jgi:carotenoid cleavage dioxygenase-like enzyme
MWTDKNPYLNGFFEPLSNEMVIREMRTEGTIPLELDGALYRATSNQRFEPLNPDQQHWFDGDGMVHAFFLKNGKASYANRWVMDDGAQAEVRAGRCLYNGLMGTSGVAQPPLPNWAPPIKVASNINVITVGGKVLALNENSPRYWEIEQGTLDTLGAFNFDDTFVDVGDEGMLTAHPHFDAETGEFLFTIINAEGPFMDCFSVDAYGEVLKRFRVEMDAPSWIHDFAFTKTKLIFFLGTLNCRARQPGRVADGKGMTFHDPDLRSRILLVDRDTGATQTIQEEDLHMVTHFLNAFDEENGKITVFAGISTMEPRDGSLVIADYFPFPLPDKGASPFSGPELHCWSIDPATGTTSHRRMGEFNGEFFRVNDDFYGRKNRYGYMAGTHRPKTAAPGFNCLIKADLENETFQYQFLSETDDRIPGEPVFVPRPGSDREDDGWILALWGDPHRNGSELVILDAANFDGPALARIRFDHHMTNGFHGNWISNKVADPLGESAC